MRDLINNNYQSILNRGLIKRTTLDSEFIDKIREEVDEFEEAVKGKLPNRDEELADIILVCLNYAKHHAIDIESELWRKIKINEQR